MVGVLVEEDEGLIIVVIFVDDIDSCWWFCICWIDKFEDDLISLFDI